MARLARSTLLLACLLSGCGAASDPARTAPPETPTSAVIDAASSPSSSEPPPVRPPRRTRAELAEGVRVLREADASYQRRELAKAKEGYLYGWELVHPNPLALAMAAYSASGLGDSAEAQRLLERAHEETKNTPPCSPDPSPRAPLLEEPTGVVWKHDHRDRWFRLDDHNRAMLGFCGLASRGPSEHLDLPFTWTASRPTAAYVEADVSAPVTDKIALRDPIYGDALGELVLPFSHWTYNEGYNGDIATSLDGSLLAVAGDKTVRVWSLSDHVQRHDFPLRAATKVVFSPDGRFLAAASCDEVVIWSLEQNKGVSVVKPTMECVYGGGVGAPVSGLVFSEDDQTIALTYISTQAPMEMPRLPPSEEGEFFAIHRVKDGKRLNRFSFDAQGTLVALGAGPVGSAKGAGTAYGCNHGAFFALDTLTGTKSPRQAEICDEYRPEQGVYRLSDGKRILTDDAGVLLIEEATEVRLAPPATEVVELGSYLLPRRLP